MTSRAQSQSLIVPLEGGYVAGTAMQSKSYSDFQWQRPVSTHWHRLALAVPGKPPSSCAGMSISKIHRKTIPQKQSCLLLRILGSSALHGAWCPRIGLVGSPMPFLDHVCTLCSTTALQNEYSCNSFEKQ